jgi:tRNA nucleotidyltransferase (CCA-adding enzyme)
MNPFLSTQVRLLKRFLRALDAYGAEIAVRGFSGYVCEVLVLHFGSFVEMLKAAATFGPRQVIGPTPLPREALKRFNSPLVIPDPVDPRRNLGTAISQQRVTSLILGARRFLAHPSLHFFRETPRAAVPTSHPLLDNVVGLLFKHDRVSVDILWGQLRRTEEFLARQLKLAGYGVLRRAPASNDRHESGIVFLFDTPVLPRFQVKMGPPIYRRDDTARFVRRNRRAPLLWTDDAGRALGLVSRRLVTAPDVLAALTRATRAGSGIAPGLYPAIRKSAKVYRGGDLVRVGRTRTWLAQCLTRILRTSELEFGSG